MSVKGARADLRVFEVGQLITILPEFDGEATDVEQKSYSSRIESVCSDALIVTMPTRKRIAAPLPLNSGISGCFQRRGARYYFRATVVAQQRSPVPTMMLTNIGDVTKVERRFYVRVDACIEPLEIVERGAEHAKPQDMASSIVVNISAGGLGIVCRRPLAEGSIVKLTVPLPKEFGTLNAEAEVVRCTQVNVRGMRKWRVGLAFLKMDEVDLDRVSAFVLKQQQALHRRGLL